MKLSGKYKVRLIRVPLDLDILAKEYAKDLHERIKAFNESELEQRTPMDD